MYATLAGAGQTFSFVVATDAAATFNTGANYSVMRDTWYTSATIGRIVGNAGNGNYAPDGLGTMAWESATGAAAKGITGFLDLDVGGAAESSGAYWKFRGELATGVGGMFVKGDGYFIQSRIHGVRINIGTSVATDTVIELWGRRVKLAMPY